jgi:hypothetical protein
MGHTRARLQLAGGLYESGSESDSDDAPRPKVCAYVERFSGLPHRLPSH